ncbi:hypothetical protein SGQ83_07995 [Flavobacterium sp. Fl-318]|uniref:Uncharacterized protein n=1 Tax=Flavobacterium cupriresistens TaxID=2893885 RepID=A0ABU4R9M7_9FLAO|nr:MULTISPECIES: hypothetical protein [unclassified Flavobacterium]MDX6189282.1 hypothetical protein [Flavobacterium sp. Fl-318]UFH41378.1 hypothetical protein LNP23_16365 [Flavobacterium sp. F-323]
MKKTAYFLLIVSGALSFGCGRTFFYSNECYTSNYIEVNSQSDVFIRKLYLNEEYEKTKDSISLTNKKEQKNLLIEVQYLIFNPNKEIIYIATTPSRYIEDKTDAYLIHSRKNIYPNSYFLNTFYFGREISSDGNFFRKIEFRNKKMTQEWRFDKIDSNNMKLSVIDNYKIKRVFINQKKEEEKVFVSTENVNLSSNHDIEFQKIPYFHYLSFKIPQENKQPSKAASRGMDSLAEIKYTIYDEHCQKKDTFSKKKLYPRAEKIYFKYWNNKLEYIFIPFSLPVNGYHSIKFKSSKVKFDRLP